MADMEIIATPRRVMPGCTKRLQSLGWETG